ncbi:MAG: zinc ribbon domain-containing protein [Promethearchaeota archaeon]
MVEAAIETNFTCSCGAPLIVMTLDPAPGNKISAMAFCPKHRIGQNIILDHSGLDLWIGVVADRLFRCALCGREITSVPSTGSSQNATTFTLTCPQHGTQNNTRTVWSVIYRRLLTEIKNRREARTISQPVEFSPEAATENETQPPDETLPQTKSSKEPVVGYCSQCGKKIRPHDEFCFNCGASIED